MFGIFGGGAKGGMPGGGANGMPWPGDPAGPPGNGGMPFGGKFIPLGGNGGIPRPPVHVVSLLLLYFWADVAHLLVDREKRLVEVEAFQAAC